ncbi:MAG: hypothetical protein CBB87_03320 [Micavibrio sp. TMED27]|nr:hypothetical protein [Micavibrio sp.]OUT91862.1 MAG: hypothetical protein CBB87_03320 [Micavibrio sp. TMED27]|tara:strand:+ start:1421 stop:1789 length:369 start_codon:yes stop_codon:yes gene_type:complete
MAKILIADDNVDFAELLSNILTSNGYETFVTFDGRQAIDHLGEVNDYDLIITDVIMPYKDGFDLIEYARENKMKAKIIAISGGGFLVDANKAVQAIDELADASLKKPVKMAEILECVETVLA